MSYTNSQKGGWSRGIFSESIHVPRAQFVTVEVVEPKWAKNTILTVIAGAMLVMVTFTLFNFIATPEYLIKKEINSITADYYENYYYTSILNANSIPLNAVSGSSSTESALEHIFSPYEQYGFARVSLQQLLLFDNQRHAASTATLAEYCNLAQTSVKIYPESPFKRTDYRADYSYSCKF